MVEVEKTTDDVWREMAKEDASPSLAVLGETHDYARQISLTFDDGPDPDVTPHVLDVLRDRGVRATYFVVGRNVARNPEIV